MYESDPGFYDFRREMQDAGYRVPWLLPDPRDPSLEERTRPEPIGREFSLAERRLVRALEEGDRESQLLLSESTGRRGDGLLSHHDRDDTLGPWPVRSRRR